MQKEFKVGDRIKIKEGVSEGYYEAGAEGVVIVCSNTILVKFDKGIYDPSCSGTWYVNFDQAIIIEKEEKHQYKEGDKVVFLHMEEDAYNADYDNEHFTIGKVYVLLDQEDGYWPDHVKVTGNTGESAFARKDQVKLVQEEAQPEKYTVAEVFDALLEVDDTHMTHMTEEVEAYLKKKQDPEWQEFQRLKKKFEG